MSVIGWLRGRTCSRSCGRWSFSRRSWCCRSSRHHHLLWLRCRVRRHAITNKNLVQKLIQSSAGSPAGGESREYTGFAQRFSCDISGRCTEVERIPLRAIVDFRRDPALNGQKGVITAYCNHGPLECPSWVSNVANVAR